MADSFEKHGYLLLMPSSGVVITQKEADSLMMRLGFGPFQEKTDSGRPAVVILSTQMTKGGWLEAGFWAGARVPLIVLGGALKVRHAETISRLGGWVSRATTLDDLAAVIQRLGIRPTKWDESRIEAVQEAIARKQQSWRSPDRRLP